MHLPVIFIEYIYIYIYIYTRIYVIWSFLSKLLNEFRNYTGLFEEEFYGSHSIPYRHLYVNNSICSGKYARYIVWSRAKAPASLGALMQL